MLYSCCSLGAVFFFVFTAYPWRAFFLAFWLLKHPLSTAAKDALIVKLWQELQQLRQQLNKPSKTSKNSSMPPSQGFKLNRKSSNEQSQAKSKSSGGEGHGQGGRPLSEHPDEIHQAIVEECSDCGASLSLEQQRVVQRYEKIDIPPIRARVTRVERYGCTCPECGSAQVAAVPEALAPGSPFGERIAAIVTSLRYSHAISYQRLQQVLADLFSVEISEGGIANLLGRVKEQLAKRRDEILSVVRQARWLGSDETSARVDGRNQWEWVFQNQQVCLHVIRPSRGAKVMREVLGSHQPEVWVSDLYSAQKTHPSPE
jgi:transposase